MEASAKPLFYAKRMKTLVAWYKAVPESLQLDFPRLLLFAARALIYFGQLDEALPLLHRAVTTFEKRGEFERAFFAMLQRAEIYYIHNRYDELLRLTQQALREAESYPAPAAEAHRLAGLACLNLGRPEEAVEHLQAALALCRKLGLTHETAMTYRELAFALSRLGQVSESWNCLQRAIEFFRQIGPSDQLALTLNNVAYDRYHLTGDYSRALSHLNEALEVAQTVGSSREMTFILLSIAELYRDLGALEQAKTFYEKADKIAGQLGDSSLVSFALTGTAQVELLAGDTVSALALAVQARNQAEEQKDIYQLGLSCLTLGDVYLSEGNSEAALIEIGRGQDLLVQSGARRDLTRACMLLARAHKAAGNIESALSALSRALDIGIETQTFHHLVIEGQRVFELLKRLSEHNPADRRSAEIMDRVRALPDVAREIVGGLAPTALPHSPTLRFFGFGSGKVEKDGELISTSVWRSALARYLIFYLLVHPPRSRNQITETFWPDIPRDKAGAIFHWIKHRIRRTLGCSLIVYKDGLYSIELDPDCWFDVATFESLLDGQDGRQIRLEEAIALYKGDFLEGYDGEWCSLVQKRLHFCFRDALLELGELYTAQGQLDRAFTVLNQAMALDDLHEPVVRALMHLYSLDDRRQAALNLFLGLEQRLRRELDIPPDPETQRLYQAIQDS
jgi:DNA-binding SARP family transcriptional activator/Tfp pilus assembly protein PilF